MRNFTYRRSFYLEAEVELRKNTHPVTIRTRTGFDRPPLGVNKRRRLRYLLRLHSYFNLLSKRVAKAKDALWQMILKIIGLNVELVRLEDKHGHLSCVVSESKWDEELAVKLVGDNLEELTRLCFTKVAKIDVAFEIRSPEDLIAIEQAIREKITERQLRLFDGNRRYELRCDEAELASLCNTWNRDFPDAAKEILNRNPRWMKPLIESRPVQLTDKTNEEIALMIEEIEAEESIPKQFAAGQFD